MTFLGFLIVLLIGAAIGYFFANMRGGAADTGRNGDRNGNRNMVRQRPTSSHAFMTETGEIGSEDGQSQGQSLQNQGPVKPAYSSASVFLQNKDQVDRNQASMSQSQGQSQGMQSQGLQSQPVKTASSSASVFEQSGTQGQSQGMQSQGLQSQPVKTASSSASVFEQSGTQGQGQSQSLSSQNTYTTGGTQQNVGTNDQSAGNEQTSGSSGSDGQLLQ